MSTPHFDLEMDQGADWSNTFNWYGGGTFRAPIEEIDPGYPTQIRVTAHGLPSSSDTPVILSGIIGAEVLNSKDTGIEMCTRVDADYFTVPVSTVASEWLVGTGEMTFYLPTNIAAFTARCKLKKYWHSTTALATLTTENGGIVLDANDGSIKLIITDTVTAGFTFTTCVYDVEMISGTGEVTRAFKGTITLSREITDA